METVPRGFSFMPKKSTDNFDFQYIEGQELEKAWKNSRRERVRQQETKIWKEFCGEEDLISNVCSEDPYQFLDKFPESYLKDLMQAEMEKMKKDLEEEQLKAEQLAIKEAAKEEPSHTVNFEEPEDTEVFHIFDDNVMCDSGDEEGTKSESPATVREASPVPSVEDTVVHNLPEQSSRPSTPPAPPRQTTTRGEPIRGVLESSIYCAKLKEIRWKINEALIDFMDSLQCQNLCNIFPEDIVKLKKHSVEFSTRFSRVYMYQLQRQISDIKRHNSHALPFAKHTHFQAQMVRVTSLHQNMLQAIMVYYKCFGESLLMRETSLQLKSLLNLIRESSDLCAKISVPSDLRPSSDLYNDDILPTMVNMDHVLSEYDNKIDAFLEMEKALKCSIPKLHNKVAPNRIKHASTKSKSGTKSVKSEADARLSMYSFDKAASNLSIKQSKSNTTNKSKKSNSSIATKTATSQSNDKSNKNDKDYPKNVKKTPRSSRRPLMRGCRVPADARPRAALAPPDADVHTLVENIDNTCVSSHISEQTPRSQVDSCTSRRSSKESTPRTGTRKSQSPISSLTSPKTPRHKSQKAKIQEICKPVLDTITSEHEVKVTPADNVQRETNTQTDTDAKDVYQNINDDVFYQDMAQSRKSTSSASGCPVSALLHRLCGGDNSTPSLSKKEQVSGSKNAQLFCISSSSPRQHSTPQLLKILEETIQRKVPPRQLPPLDMNSADMKKLLLSFNLPEATYDKFQEYRTKFVQHMLASSMYANSDVGKPWEVVGRVSERIIDDLLVDCVKDMQLNDYMQELYHTEIN